MIIQAKSFGMKSNSTMVKFGDVVKNANLAERDPEAAGIERIVGLEHLEPENLHVRRWNTLENGTSFNRKFVPGQTLFGKRRAYQRKVAFAEFEGICSGDILTFEPKDPDVLLPELLPFICQTDAFFDHALGTSAGSLSPRTSYKALQDFEFPLPPIEEQKRIAEILWTADEAIAAFERSKTELETTADNFAASFLRRGWKVEPLGSLLSSIQYGSSKRIEKEDVGSVPILRIPNVLGGKIILDGLGWTSLSAQEVSKYRLSPGDLLIVRTNGNPDYVGRTAVVSQVPEDCVYASYLIRLTPDRSRLLPQYLHAALSSSLMRKPLRHEIRSSAGNYNLNTKGIKRQMVPLPPLEYQERFAARFASFIKEGEGMADHIASLFNVSKCITNKELGTVHV